MGHVFISHAAEDRGFVASEIQALLETKGISTWLSHERIKPGANWEHAIREGLTSSDWFLLAMSEQSSRSEWVAREVHWAMEERPARIVPVLIESCEISRWHIGIRRLQVIDFRSPNISSRRELITVFGSDFASPGSTPARNSADTTSFDMWPPEQQASRSWPDHVPLTGFDYFCYLSQSKINQLFAQIPEVGTPSAGDPVLVKRIADLNGRIALSRRSDPDAIVPLQKELARLQTLRNLLSLSFGARSGVGAERTSRGLEDPASLVPKARAVLRHLFELGQVHDLDSLADRENTPSALCFVHKGACTFRDYAGPGMAIITSDAGRQKLEMYCSLKYFSDMSFGPNGEAMPHSLNWAFFSGKVTYTLISFVIVTAIRGDTVLGSPICLILDRRLGAAL